MTWDEMFARLDAAGTIEAAILATAAQRRSVREAEQARDDAEVAARLHALMTTATGVEAPCTVGELLEALEVIDDEGEFADNESDIAVRLEEAYAERNDCFCRKCEDHQYDDEVPDFSPEAKVIAALAERLEPEPEA